jgi:hypothetical protein
VPVAQNVGVVSRVDLGNCNLLRINCHR